MRGSGKIYHKPYIPPICGDLLKHPYISRLAPSADGFEIEIIPMTDEECTLFYSERGKSVFSKVLMSGNTAAVSGLKCDTDYELYIEDSKGYRSKTRLLRTGEIPKGCSVINYLHPQDPYYDISGIFLGSPSLARAKDGSLISGMDYFKGAGAQNLVTLFKSWDEGKTWTHLCDLQPFYWASIFNHKDELYMLGLSTEYGNLQIIKSTDCGETWSLPVTLFYGSNFACRTGGMHRAPMQVVSHNGRLYTTCEYGKWIRPTHYPAVISIDENDDLMVAENWACTGFLPFEGKWAQDAVVKGDTIEGNVVVGPDGGLYECLRWKIGEFLKLRIDTDNPENSLEYDSLVKAPVSNSMFRIISYKGKYLLFTNRKTEASAKLAPDVLSYRNVLSLYISDDLKKFTLIKDIFNYEHIAATDIGFQYPVVVPDRDDFMLVVRSAFNNADNYHNSNYMLFLRIAAEEIQPYL